MIAAYQTTAMPRVAPMPSQEEIAQQLGIDLTSEQELIYIVSEMLGTPLPPTWTAVDTSINNEKTRNPTNASDSPPVKSTSTTRLEYFNCVTNVRTPQHPGTPYFLAAVESERRRRANRRGRADGIIMFGATPTLTDKNSGDIDERSSATVPGQCDNSLEHTYTRLGSEGVLSQQTPSEVADIGDRRAFSDDDKSNPSEVKVVYKDMSEPDVISATTTIGNETTGRSCHLGKPVSTARSKGGRRRTPPPKWLVFTSWWHETTSGTENTMNRKHASIRYSTADGSFEVELEDVPAIFEVSHANGRHGKIGSVDIRVGAQISILGRQMRLMQCDGATAQWLEGEVRAITKAKAALVSALEEGKGDSVRVRCRSDRLAVSASAQRGSGSVGKAAEMDRRALMQDVLSLRDMLAQTDPDKALRLTEGLTSI